MVQKLVPAPFSKIEVKPIRGTATWNFYALLLLYVQVENYKNLFKLWCWPLPLISSFFKKTKGSLELVSLPQFLHDFEGKYFYQLIPFHCLIAFTSCDIGQYAYCNYLFPVADVRNFEINLSFLIKLFSYMTKKF